MIYNFNDGSVDPNEEFHTSYDEDALQASREEAIEGIVTDKVTIPNANRVLEGRILPKKQAADELINNAAANNYATAISVAPATTSIAVAATRQLTPTLTPANAIDVVKYTTSDATKATVSTSGLITGVAEGTATVTATSKRGHKATCAVTVTA